jgi:hypothetical protein
MMARELEKICWQPKTLLDRFLLAAMFLNVPL